MNKIIWTNFAITELKNIYLYHKIAVSKTLANKLKRNIFKTTNKLTKNPLLCSIEENLISLKQEHRYLIEGNYKIIYRVVIKEIYIVDVFDCRQNPQKIKLRANK